MIMLLMILNLCFGSEIERNEIYTKQTGPKKMATAITAFVVIANLVIYSPIIYANLKQNEQEKFMITMLLTLLVACGEKTETTTTTTETTSTTEVSETTNTETTTTPDVAQDPALLKETNVSNSTTTLSEDNTTTVELPQSETK